MKTAVSIPDSIFLEGDQLAKRMGLSRSELYSRAVSGFVKFHSEEGTTEALNRVYSEESSAPDPVLSELQWASLPNEEW